MHSTCLHWLCDVVEWTRSARHPSGFLPNPTAPEGRCCASVEGESAGFQGNSTALHLCDDCRGCLEPRLVVGRRTGGIGQEPQVEAHRFREGLDRDSLVCDGVAHVLEDTFDRLAGEDPEVYDRTRAPGNYVVRDPGSAAWLEMFDTEFRMSSDLDQSQASSS